MHHVPGRSNSDINCTHASTARCNGSPSTSNGTRVEETSALHTASASCCDGRGGCAIDRRKARDSIRLLSSMRFTNDCVPRVVPHAVPAKSVAIWNVVMNTDRRETTPTYAIYQHHFVIPCIATPRSCSKQNASTAGSWLVTNSLPIGGSSTGHPVAV